LKEANVAESDYVIVEFRKLGQGWYFQGDEAPSLDECKFCYKYENPKHSCAFKEVHEKIEENQSKLEEVQSKVSKLQMRLTAYNSI